MELGGRQIGWDFLGEGLSRITCDYQEFSRRNRSRERDLNRLRSRLRKASATSPVRPSFTAEG